jgi:hypothetical protein
MASEDTTKPLDEDNITELEVKTMRLTKQQREAKLKEWQRHERKKRILERGPMKVPRDQIVRLDSETVAINRAQEEEAIQLLTESGFKFWPLGPLREVCSRPEHDANWFEA